MDKGIVIPDWFSLEKLRQGVKPVPATMPWQMQAQLAAVFSAYHEALNEGCTEQDLFLVDTDGFHYIDDTIDVLRTRFPDAHVCDLGDRRVIHLWIVPE